jgi:hypothetical protein
MTAAAIGSTPTSRISRSSSNTPTPAAKPTIALRVNVSSKLTISAGTTTAAQPRSRMSYSSRATAAQITSINVPE